MYSVYALIDPRDETVHYVGLSKDVQLRFHTHLHTVDEWGTNPVKIAWIRELRENDMVPTLSIIEEVETCQEAEQQESYWIQQHLLHNAPLTNVKGVSMINRYTDPPRKMKPPILEKEYLTPEEVAEKLRYHPEYVRKLLREGKLPGHKYRGSWRTKAIELDAWIKEQEQKETREG